LLEILHGACPETLRRVYPEMLHGVYPEQIRSFALLRMTGEGFSMTAEGLRVTVEGFRMTTLFLVILRGAKNLFRMTHYRI
jgi:hypothetical protein